MTAFTRSHLAALVHFMRAERRLVTALVIVWVVGAVDLLLTWDTAKRPEFLELNPLAAQLLDRPLHSLAAYKFGLLAIGTSLLILTRQNRLSTWGAYFLAGTHGCLAAYWTFYMSVQNGLLLL
ncbi:MAG: hypothetical protein AB7N71_05345 [Phycisphaerae bacterium]